MRNYIHFYFLKKYFIISCFCIIPIFLNAQANLKAEINIIVSDFFELTSQRIDGQRIDMFFRNTNDFTNGVSVLKQSHLLLSSSVNYNLVARAVLENFRTTSPLTFPSTIVKINVDNTQPLSGNATLNSIEELQVNNQPLITNGRPNINENINIKYTISPEKAQKYILQAGPGTYSNTIIYTLTPQ